MDYTLKKWVHVLLVISVFPVNCVHIICSLIWENHFLSFSWYFGSIPCFERRYFDVNLSTALANKRKNPHELILLAAEHVAIVALTCSVQVDENERQATKWRDRTRQKRTFRKSIQNNRVGSLRLYSDGPIVARRSPTIPYCRATKSGQYFLIHHREVPLGQ